jgi:hypothetical protein
LFQDLSEFNHWGFISSEITTNNMFCLPEIKSARKEPGTFSLREGDEADLFSFSFTFFQLRKHYDYHTGKHISQEVRRKSQSVAKHINQFFRAPTQAEKEKLQCKSPTHLGWCQGLFQTSFAPC